MMMGICQSCGGMATQTCPMCGAMVCVRCKEQCGCKLCHGKKKV
ncbi:MAG: orotate phosphoribosyltransferase [Candidatus Aenigmarchaeota archaeon]|nr:orotate phosphoribosyltransferase [Candidatus Aenigmarchaeota archaeon]